MRVNTIYIEMICNRLAIKVKMHLINYICNVLSTPTCCFYLYLFYILRGVSLFLVFTNYSQFVIKTRGLCFINFALYFFEAVKI